MNASNPWLAHLDAQSHAAFHVVPASDSVFTEINEACTQLGYRSFTIDMTYVSGEGKLIRTLAKSFEFPRYFGGTWDGVNDLIRDLEWAPAEGYLVCVKEGETFAARGKESFSMLVSAFETAIAYWRDERDDSEGHAASKAFQVILFGGSKLEERLLDVLREPLCDHTSGSPLLHTMPRGLRPIELFDNAGALARQGADIESTLAFLRAGGISKRTSRYFLAGAYGLPVHKAKTIVDSSRTWHDEQDEMRPHREAARRALEALAEDDTSRN